MLRFASRFGLHFALLLLAAAITTAQTDDIFKRLRQALAPSGQGEAAATALAHKNFVEVEQMLARAEPASEAERSELLSLRGAVEFLAGNMSAAAAAFTQAAEFRPLKDADAFTEAMALINLGDDAQARVLLSDLAKKHPDRAIYTYWLGRLNYYQRRYQEAVEKLRRATELDPNSARAWDSLGLAFDMEGQMEQALVAFEKGASLNRAQSRPSPWPPHDLGYLLLRLERSKDAEDALRESLRYDAQLAQAHFHLGRALEKEGKDLEAIDEFIAAVNGDPRSSDACYSLALLYRKLHRDRDADAMFAEFKRRKEASTSKESPERQPHHDPAR